MEEPIAEVAKALIKAQQEFAPIKKSATNPHFKNKFVPLHELMQAVLPVLNKHGLAISQWPVTTEDGDPGLATYLLHESGQFMEAVMPLLVAKQDPQGQGSALTYARRYAVMAVLGIVGDEDDDAEAATKVAQRPRRPAASAWERGEPESLLDKAKDELRRVIKQTNANGKDYAWVKDCTDIDAINEQTKALQAVAMGGLVGSSG